MLGVLWLGPLLGWGPNMFCVRRGVLRTPPRLLSSISLLSTPLRRGPKLSVLAGRIENNRYILVEAGNYVTPWICRVSEHHMVSPDMCDA